MCKRDTTDPLVRMFLDRYKINLLAVPRADAACGQVYVRNGRRVSSGVAITQLVEPQVTLPAPYEGEVLADLAGSLSDGVSVDVGLGLLEGFLGALGAAGVVASVSAGVERSRTASLRFRFTGGTRDSVDAGSLAAVLEGRRLRGANPLVQPGNEYFVTAAVIRTPSLTLLGEDKRRTRVEFGAEVMAAATPKAGVTVESGEAGEVTFRGSTALAIGLELYELRDGGEDGRLSMVPQDPRDPVHAAKDRPPRPAFAAPDDEALLALDEAAPAPASG